MNERGAEILSGWAQLGDILGWMLVFGAVACACIWWYAGRPRS